MTSAANRTLFGRTLPLSIWELAPKLDKEGKEKEEEEVEEDDDDDEEESHNCLNEMKAKPLEMANAEMNPTST